MKISLEPMTTDNITTTKQIPQNVCIFYGKYCRSMPHDHILSSWLSRMLFCWRENIYPVRIRRRANHGEAPYVWENWQVYHTNVEWGKWDLATVSDLKRTSYHFNALRPIQNGRHFADAILKCIFLNENVWIPIEISLKFVPKGPIDNIPALV